MTHRIVVDLIGVSRRSARERKAEPSHGSLRHHHVVAYHPLTRDGKKSQRFSRRPDANPL
jgi:hypothetical protein